MSLLIWTMCLTVYDGLVYRNNSVTPWQSERFLLNSTLYHSSANKPRFDFTANIFSSIATKVQLNLKVFIEKIQHHSQFNYIKPSMNSLLFTKVWKFYMDNQLFSTVGCFNNWILELVYNQGYGKCNWST